MFEDNKIDIALIASDVSSSFDRDSYTFETKQSLEWFFHYSFAQYFDNKASNFIPYAIDPLLIITTNKDISHDSIINIYDQDPSSFLFGYDLATISLLKANNEPYPNYFYSSYWLIKDRFDTNNTGAFKRYIDAQSKWSRSLIKIRQLTTKLNPTIKDCVKLPHICLLVAGETKTILWTLSDVVNINTNYPNFNADNLVIFGFPTTNQPIKWRGWVINKQSPQLVESLEFMGSYLAAGWEWNARIMPNKMLSAFNSIYSLQTPQTFYADYNSKPNKIKLLFWSLEWQDFYINKSPITTVLGWEFNIELYFSDPGWTY